MNGTDSGLTSKNEQKYKEKKKKKTCDPPQFLL